MFSTKFKRQSLCSNEWGDLEPVERRGNKIYYRHSGSPDYINANSF